MARNLCCRLNIYKQCATDGLQLYKNTLENRNKLIKTKNTAILHALRKIAVVQKLYVVLHVKMNQTLITNKTSFQCCKYQSVSFHQQSNILIKHTHTQNCCWQCAESAEKITTKCGTMAKMQHKCQLTSPAKSEIVFAVLCLLWLILIVIEKVLSIKRFIRHRKTFLLITTMTLSSFNVNMSNDPIMRNHQSSDSCSLVIRHQPAQS